MSLKDPYSIQVLRSFLRSVENAFSRGVLKEYTIDFREIIFQDLTVILLFKAWVDGIHERYPNCKIRGFYNFQDPVFHLIIKVGLVDSIPTSQTEKPPFNASDKNQRVLSYTSDASQAGVNSEPRLSVNVADLFSNACNHDFGKISITAAAINEALHNVRNWAYDELDIDKKEQKWWLLGSIFDPTNEFTIIVYDEGKCLPNHFSEKRLSKHGVIGDALGVGVKAGDSEKINAAVKLGTNPVRKLVPDGRGRGLNQMKSLSDNFSEGNFLVKSGFGLYEYSSKNGMGSQSVYKEVDYHLPGTLVSWVLKE